MIRPLGYDPAAMTGTDVLGMAGAAAGLVIIVLAVAIALILINGPRL